MSKPKKKRFVISPSVRPDTKVFMEAVIAKLEDVGAVEACDYPALNMLQLAYNNYLTASDMLLKDGPVVKDKHGHVIVHPAVNVVSKTWGQVVALMKEFGLTVKSRDHISSMTPQVDEDNELAQFGRMSDED